MKRNKLIFIILIGFVFNEFLQAQVMWQIKTDDVKKWYYTGGDEFNEAAVNTEKWNYAPSWGSAVPKQSVFYTGGANVYQADGAAHFVLKKEKYLGHVYPWELDSVWVKKNNIKIENDNMWFNYTTGQLISKTKFKYGFFECRFKSNNERGIWPAFWLYAGHDNDEIDWFELKCEKPNQAHVDAHCPDGCDNYRGGFLNLTRGWGGWIKMTKALSQEYNVISGEWNENYLVWYLNGVPMCYFKHNYEFPMWLILNTTIASDNSGGFSPGPDETTKFPNEYIVDYVRIWTNRDTTKELLNNSFQNSDNTIKNQSAQNISQIKKPLKFIYNKKVLNKELGTVTFLPLANQQYSLTFTGFNFREVKIEIQNGAKQKVKEFNVTNPNYFIVDAADLQNGTYTIVVNILGKLLAQDFVIKKMAR